MDTVIFANGVERNCSFLSVIGDGIAFIALSDSSMSEVVSIFSNPEYTSSIRFGDNRLVGYTELVAVSVQPYGIQARLRGGHVEQIV